MLLKFCALFFFLVVVKSSTTESSNGKLATVYTTPYSTFPSPEKNNRLDELQTKLLEALIHSGTNTTRKYVPKNCKEIQEQGHNITNIYYIQPQFSSEAFPVVCDMKTKGGGWTYIMNRFDGSEDFYLGWSSYKEGFGNLAGEFWLGLEKMHLLTGYEFNELLIEIVDWDNKQVEAHYNTFTIGSEKEGYVLKVLEGFSGSAGDSLKNEAGMRFTTTDKDQDLWREGNCADFSEAAWWYRNCKWSHLTGKYFKDSNSGKNYLKGIYWVTYRKNTYSHKEIRMMVRPRLESKSQLLPRKKFDY